MKKILSFVLALSLVLGLCAVGLAADGGTVGMSAAVGGLSEGGTLKVSKSINDPQLEGFTWDMTSPVEPESVKLDLLSEDLYAKILNPVQQNEGWTATVRTYGLEKHRFSERHLGQSYPGTLTISFKDGTSAEWKVQLTVTDDPTTVPKPYLVNGRYIDGKVPGGTTRVAEGGVWEQMKTINRHGTTGYPFTLFSDKKPETVTVTYDGKELRCDSEDQVQANGEYRSVYWTGVETIYQKEDVGKVFNGEISVTWADKTTSSFLFRLTVTDSPYPHQTLIDKDGNEVDSWKLEKGETYTAKIILGDQNGRRGQEYAGQEMTIEWGVETGYERISVSQDSSLPHDENGIPQAGVYGKDPSTYIVPADTSTVSGVNGLPFSVTFTAKEEGEFTLCFKEYYNGERRGTNRTTYRIRGDRNIVSDSAIADSFASGQEEVVIPVPTGSGFNNGSFEKIFELAKENGTKTVSLKVAGATNGSSVYLTFDVSRLDTQSADYKAFLKDLEERNGGVYDPSVNLNMPDSAKNHGFGSRKGQWLDFAHSGKLPAPMTVTVDVPEGTFGKDVDKLHLWYYNSVTGRADDTGTDVDLKDGKAAFTIDHCSAWVLYPAGYDPNPKATTTGAGGSSGSSGSGTADFDWADARSTVKAAKAGGTVRLTLPSGERVPASLLRALAAKDNVTLILRQGGKSLRISSDAIGTLEKAEYRFSELQSLFGSADSEQEVSGSELNPGKANPGTGASDR